MGEVMRFKSAVAGKNSDVVIHEDRIEWTQDSRLGSRRGSEVIPMRNVSSISTKKDGLTKTVVQVITTGNTVDFRVGHGEAEQIKAVILDLMNRAHGHAPTLPPPPGATLPPPAAPTEDPTDRLLKLGEMHTAGLLSDEEFSAAKAQLLGGSF